MFDKITYYLEEIVGGIMFVGVMWGLFFYIPDMMKTILSGQ